MTSSAKGQQSVGGLSAGCQRGRIAPRLPLGILPLAGRAAVLLFGAAAAVGLLACGAPDSSSSSGAEGSGSANEAAQDAPVREETAPASPIDQALLPDGVTATMVAEGRELFSGGGICFTCHLDGTGGPLAPDLTDDLWINVDGEYGSIVELVKTGVPKPIEHPGAMLPRAGMPLTDPQVEAVSAYVYALSRGLVAAGQ